ncbi:hypothetical protein HJB56_09840 [Rhizobium lentis]|uniref:hypothetical protein n=1 Tax=Rhizobium lentis TaxID=1138194 RepID=UPI001C82F70A|nr:hypothetical protein [Rhizobium lentis]MBX5083062.1 hypothetical protein [Rhizobium lentis]MBX5095797.1 hypothetical protein [Rhizobium lentis]MBX5120355.1 hypothetical protein [Rhizobium lentis]
MRLDFNVLWVEDNQGLVESQKDRIAAIIRKEGFRLAVEFAPSVEKATEFLASSIYGDHIDLVLMDYDLGAGKKGDEGVAEVRDTFAYKDIIFYSGQATTDLAAMIAKKQIPGVFTAHRPELPDVVEGVFENLVRKVLDIDHSRGIVMGATSDIDQQVNMSLANLFDAHENLQDSSLQIVKDRIVEKRDQLGKALEAIEKIKHLKELEEHHLVYSSDERFRLLTKIMKAAGIHQEHKGSFESYRGTIMPRRNDLAHIRVVRDGFSRKLFDRKGNEITVEAMKALRVELLDFHELFDSLFAK